MFRRVRLSRRVRARQDLKMKRVCVECGKKSADQQLYREFSGGTIQLSQCVSHSSTQPTHSNTVSTSHCIYIHTHVITYTDSVQRRCGQVCRI